MDSLALLAEVEAIIAQGDTDADPLLVAYAAVEVLPRVVAALRPFTAPVGVEAFEGLRREHDPGCADTMAAAGEGCPCLCGASDHNARVDALRAAHVAALGEAERVTEQRDEIARDGERLFNAKAAELDALRAAILATPDPSGCQRCGEAMCPYPAAVQAHAAATLHNIETLFAAVEEAELDCHTRPCVNWPSVLAGLRQSAGGK